MFRDQLHAIAEEGLMTAQQADKRAVYLAGAVFETLVESALDAHSKRFSDKADALLKKSYFVYQHPLLLLLLGGSEEKVMKDGVTLGVQMLIAKAGLVRVPELIRFLEGTRQKLAGTSAPNEAASSECMCALIMRVYFYLFLSLQNLIVTCENIHSD